MPRRTSNQRDARRDVRLDPTRDPMQREGLDPGAFVGRMPERQAETIPGGVGPKDERISAVASQSGDGPSDPGETATPDGHREGTNATSDIRREAGQNR